MHLDGYTFHDKRLMRTALTHSSYMHENNLCSTECNERLEFLGDAVLELVVSEYLFIENPSLSEGELTKRRARLVCEISLARLARRLSLGAHLRLGKGEAASGGRERKSLLADAFEAIIGAVFLDGGFENARNFVLRLLAEHTAGDSDCCVEDPKSHLQELLQKKSQEPIVYTITDETGPPHKRQFTAVVSHEGHVLGHGTGKTKKGAEQNAASDALTKMDSIERR